MIILLTMPGFFRLMRVTCRSPSHSLSPGGIVRTSSAPVLRLILLSMTLFRLFDKATVLLSQKIFPIQSPLPGKGDQAE